MRRELRGRRLLAVAAIAAGTTWLIYAVWRSPHRNDLASFGQYAAALAVIAAGLIGRVWNPRTGRDDGIAGASPKPDSLLSLLATAVHDQWTSAAAERGLVEPTPIPVQWARPSLPLAGPASAAASSRRFSPLPGLEAIGTEQLQAGRISDLHAIYGGLGSGRLVIAGPPGSGKSGAAVLLILAALRYRETLPEPDRSAVPVPVMFTMHGWNPNSQRFEDWLTSRLMDTYSLFTGRRGKAVAAELVRAGRIGVLLDGLDEIPAELQPSALKALSAQAAFRLVMLSRTADMAEAAEQERLTGAATVELQDVAPSVAAGYLTRVQLDPPPHGWRELIDRLRNQPNSPLARALGSPLTLTLIRDTYHRGDDVRELLDFCDSAGVSLMPEDIEDYLLDRVLSAAYAPLPGQAPPPYELPTAQRVLAHIAARMNQDGTRDLAWWQIPAWTPRTPRIIASFIAAGLVAGLVAGLTTGLQFGLLPGLATGILAGLGTGVATIFAVRNAANQPLQSAPPRRKDIFSLRSLKYMLVLGLPTGLALGLTIGLVPPRSGLVAGLVGGSVGGLAVGLAIEPAERLLYPETGHPSPFSPMASWRNDRNISLGVAVVAVVVIVVVGAAAFAPDRRLALSAPFAVGVAVGLPVGSRVSAIWQASLASAQLARRWHGPIRLMRFLEDSRERNILRTVGPVYQFRHARLQDRLALQEEQTPGHEASQAIRIPAS